MKYLSILNSTLDGIILIKRDGSIAFCNDTAYSMLGYADKELEGQSVEALLPEAFRHAHVKQRNSYINEPQRRSMNQNKRFLAMRKDGSEFPVAISLNPIEIDGETYISASIQNMSDAEQESIKLEHAQKLEALGEMVSGIAHNFNNVIAGISGQTYLLAEQESLSVKGRDRLESVGSLCKQAAEIIKQLMLYARHQSDEYHDFLIGDAIREVLTIANITAPKNISIQFNEEKGRLRIHGSSNQIQQTLLNLINNAMHAIGDADGSIDISMQNCTGSNCQFKPCGVDRSDASSFACMKVCDNGKGIAEKHLNRIFDPFFTTKPQGQGTGLGLSTSYGIIKKHGGDISVLSQQGEGSTFKIALPVATRQSLVTKKTASINPIKTDQAVSILIIDDEPPICNVLADILNGFGYTTLTASDGEAGVETFIRQQHDIALVISDMFMPKLGGKEVLAKIREIAPIIPFLFITGYQDNAMDTGMLDDNTQLILKPFDFVALSHEINKMIQR